MATGSAKHKQRRAKSSLSAGEVSRRWVAGLFRGTPLSPSSGGEAAHRVASIVVETDKKGRCEERSFDNRTGQIVSSNYVDCDARLADERDTTPSENMSAERMRAILGAFRR